MPISWRGRMVEALIMLTALFVFVYSVARDAPVGVIVFAGAYLLVATVALVPRWRARRAARASRGGSAPDGPS
jgi:hypothetical protein